MAKKDQEELDEPTLEDLEEEEDSEDIEAPAEEEEKGFLVLRNTALAKPRSKVCVDCV